MHINKTKALAETALTAALSTVFLLLGTFISVNTIFFTALAAYLIGYSIHKFGLRYGGIQWVSCVLLDFFLNPNKVHGILYLCLGGYIFLSEWVFQRWNRRAEGQKKMRMQLIYNWILFNIIYVPLLIFFREILFGSGVSGGAWLLWAAGQIGWFVYDRAYHAFFRMIREQNKSC